MQSWYFLNYEIMAIAI